MVAAIAVLALWPLGLGAIASHPRPAASYAEAVQRVTALQAQEGDDIRPDCRTQLLTHGARAARVVVLVHGYTAGVPQFVPLGQQFFDRGDNVLLVRLPHHGWVDRLTNKQGQLLATELAGLADEEAHAIARRVLNARLEEVRKSAASKELIDTYSTYLALKQRFEYAED